MTTHAPKPPNLVVIMADDHAAWAAGCYGHASVRTPSMDYLAGAGARCAQAYTPNPVCSPARACFFTGRLPSQHGIHDWLQEDPAQSRDWLENETTLPALLQRAGYKTGLVGKWHCGNSHRIQPGFDSWFGYRHGQYPHFGYQRFNDQGRSVDWHGRQAPYLADRAVDFIRSQSAAQPFFLFLGLVDTHSPFTGHPERLAAAYRADPRLGEAEQEPPPDHGWIRFGVPPTPEQRHEWFVQYCAATSLIDEQIGRVLDALEGLGQLDRTLMVYTSDHGHMNGQHGLYTKGNASVPQNFYEESIRVPLLLRHPEFIPARTVLHQPVDHCDLFQTLLDYAGALTPSDRNYPGRSFRPCLTQPDAPWRSVQFCEYGNARMVRTATHKLIVRYAPHAADFGDELYDLIADPRERCNRLRDPACAGLVAGLRNLLESHFSQYEITDRSGRDILARPIHNASEPWRLERPVSCPPEGTDWRVLAGY